MTDNNHINFVYKKKIDFLSSDLFLVLGSRVKYDFVEPKAIEWNS